MKSVLRRRAPAVLVAVLAAAALVAAGACSPSAPSPSPTYAVVPIGPTPWPNGTVGQYGLHVDPSLLAKLPKFVLAMPVIEDTGSEQQAMDNADLPKTFDAYAAGAIGAIGDEDWLVIAVGRLKPENQNPAFIQAWTSEYATGACSRAGAVSGTSQEQIGDFLADISTCSDGPIVYTVLLGNGVILSMYDLGPKDLGRKLLATLY